jgi:hypothetical protein
MPHLTYLYCRYITAFFSLCLCLPLPASAMLGKFVTLTCREAGMFSICNDVLALLDCYERKIYRGIHVDFAQSGLYYDADYGSNWWTYYFSPIRYNFKNKIQANYIHVDGENLPGAMLRPALRAFNRNAAYKLINKHIHIKPKIITKIDSFVEEHFKDTFVFGIHYRGTDKIVEAPRVPYRKVVKQLKQTISELGLEDYKIFIATDEYFFLNYIKKTFPQKVCSYTSNLRSHSNKPMHLDHDNKHYQRGEEAIIDCVLLSKTNYLIRTSSNLSLWSTYFNPDIPVVDLSARYEP